MNRRRGERKVPANLGLQTLNPQYLAACQVVHDLYYRPHERAELVMGLQWYDDNADNPSWIKALAELRQHATREGYCYQHVQAITVAIDQYAEKALGNRDYFLNKPYGVG
jgi:hypothetical protein